MASLGVYKGWKLFSRLDGKVDAIKIRPTRYFTGDNEEQVKKSIDRRETESIKNRIDSSFSRGRKLGFGD